MTPLSLTVLAAKQAWRHPLRSGLTVLGVATGMFLFASVQSLQRSVAATTEATAANTQLIVYRENRFCPFTSRLPERYEQTIREIPGVREVVPMKVVVNNCRASLDVVTFRGIPPEDYDRLLAERATVLEGSLADWRDRGDAALVGDVLARRRNFAVGETFEAAGVAVHVAGIIESEGAQDRNVAYVHLPFLQQQARGGLGEVTQFSVAVERAGDLDRVAKAIDRAFAADSDPTHTRPEQAHVSFVGKGMIELVGFTRWVGIGAVAAVLALIANTVVLAVRTRVKEIAILGTIGYGDLAIGWLVLTEGIALGLIGGLIGGGAAWALLHLGGYSLSSEGLSIVVDASLDVVLLSAAIAAGLGLLAGIFPAWRAARQPIVRSLRDA